MDKTSCFIPGQRTIFGEKNGDFSTPLETATRDVFSYEDINYVVPISYPLVGSIIMVSSGAHFSLSVFGRNFFRQRYKFR